MKPQVLADYEALSRRGADLMIESLRAKPNAIYCLAAGATPTRTYALVAEHYPREPGLFDQVRVLKLDEWGGLAMDEPASCEQFLQQTIAEPLGLRDRYVAFDGQTADPTAEAKRIAGWLQEHGPIDLCVLGLGVNGHLGFNEPGPHLVPHAHVAKLAAESLNHAMLNQVRSRPTFGLTLGMADLLQARQVLLLVSGSAKSEQLHTLLRGEISTRFPASLLWLHPNFTLLCDVQAMYEQHR
jgi:galactosamine-6-phosphate isomerase